MLTFCAISEHTTDVCFHNQMEYQTMNGFLTRTSTTGSSPKYKEDFLSSTSSRLFWRLFDPCFDCNRRFRNDILLSSVPTIFFQQFELSLILGVLFRESLIHAVDVYKIKEKGRPLLIIIWTFENIFNSKFQEHNFFEWFQFQDSKTTTILETKQIMLSSYKLNNKGYLIKLRQHKTLKHIATLHWSRMYDPFK